MSLVTSRGALMEVRNLDFAYREDGRWLRVVTNLSFTIGDGEALGLSGESGCGKSTVAYALLGYRRPNARVLNGQVLYRGEDLLVMDRAQLDHVRGNRITLVPQNPTLALSPHLRVGRQVVETLLTHKRAGRGQEAQARVSELFQLVGLRQPEVIARRYPHELSGGQQQRVCIAMALACEPELIVMDEPTTGLDVTTQAQIIALLADLRRRMGLAMLYVTHDLGVMAQIVERVGVMYAGHLMEIAPSQSLFGAPRHPYSQGLLASLPTLADDAVPVHAVRGFLRRSRLPPGCAFEPRCEHGEPSCATNAQMLESVSPGHDVACQRWPHIDARTGSGLLRVPSIAGEPGPTLLSVEHVSLRYGRSRRWWWPGAASDAPVVEDVTFTIRQGETFALVGESGAGKSTIARAIAGMIGPAPGRITFRDEVLPETASRRTLGVRRQIQYIFQNPDASLNPRTRVGDILARPLRMFFGVGGAEARQRIASSLEDVRLDASYARRYPDQLSGGERQRVAIARALIARPELLVCDEVLSALDVSVQAGLIELLAELKRRTRMAILFISHNLAVVRSLSDSVGVLYRGRIMSIGATSETFAPPFHPYTHTLLMAVPTVKTRLAPAVLGDGADPSAGGGGCPFAGRCPWQIGEVCREQEPPWRRVSRTLTVRCHLSREDLIARHAATTSTVRESCREP